MRCVMTKQYQNKDGSISCLSEGWDVTTDSNGRDYIFLGQKGAKCKPAKIYLDEENPPEKIDGKIYNAFPNSKEYELPNGQIRRRRVLSKPYPSAMKVMNRINTSTKSSYRINGDIKPINGNPRLVKFAIGYQNGQRWFDNIYIMDDLDAIMVSPAGVGRSERFIVRNDRGNLSSIPEMDYHDLISFENVKSRVKPQVLLSRIDEEDLSHEIRASEIKAPKKEPTQSKPGERNAKDSEEPGIDRATVLHSEDKDVTVIG